MAFTKTRRLDNHKNIRLELQDICKQLKANPELTKNKLEYYKLYTQTLDKIDRLITRNDDVDKITELEKLLKKSKDKDKVEKENLNNAELYIVNNEDE
jgi:superfamily II helicase